MRILVACDKCKRRYDASKREVGSHFHCLCGEKLTVQAPRGHEATVVRCSSCGSPREQGVNKCGFCSADFTIHERDLHTVCPACLTRVSDKAKFCSHCGATLAAETVAGDKSEYVCPCCGDEVSLASRRMSESQVNVLECPMCGGLWLGADAFKVLRDKAVKQTSHIDVATSGTPRMKKVAAQPSVRYRKCIICGHMMHRRQYGRGSGVVIDTCRQHGIWFDDGELQQVLEWVRLGGRADRPIVPGVGKERPQKKPATVRSASVPRKSRDFLDNLFDGLFVGLDNLFD